MDNVLCVSDRTMVSGYVVDGCLYVRTRTRVQYFIRILYEIIRNM